MKIEDKAEIIKLLTGTFEAMGQSSTPAALLLIADDLAPYGTAAVAQALVRCRRELVGRLTPAAIIERLQANDGRPEPNEAWAIALQTVDERDSAVVNEEIAQAFGAAQDILEAGDEVGARMAFIEAYKRCVREAREIGKPAHWWASLGSDKTKRELAVTRGVEMGRISRRYAETALPHIVNREPEMSIDRLLSGAVANAKDKDAARRTLREIGEMFSKISDQQP